MIRQALYDAFRPPTSRVKERGGLIARTAFLKAVEAVLYRRTPRPNHHEIPPIPGGDQGGDIKDIPLDYFWCKCEENLPDDWSFALHAFPATIAPDGKERISYRAAAYLYEAFDGVNVTDIPHRITGYRPTPERALEELFYQLRDML